MKRPTLACLAVFLPLSLPVTGLAQQATVQLETRITGNRELPRVTYILPWRQPAEPDHSWQPAQAIAEDLFQPLHRDQYRRQLYYRASLGEPGQDAIFGNNNSQETRGD